MINPLSAVGGINALHTAVQAAQMDGCCANAMMRERPRRTRDNKPVCEFYLASSEYRRLDLHHRTYKRLGHETEHDFVLICERCHPAFTIPSIKAGKVFGRPHENMGNGNKVIVE